MDNKEAIAVLKSNYPHGRIMISEAVDLSIKILETAESQTTAVQQLKAEIAALVNNFCDVYSGCLRSEAVSRLIEKLRQLSAV